MRRPELRVVWFFWIQRDRRRNGLGRLMAQLSTKLPYDQMLTKWSSALNPILANLLVQGLPLESVILVANTPQVLNHSLGRTQVGFIITDQSAAASIFRTQPLNDQTITLESNANVTINLWNF